MAREHRESASIDVAAPLGEVWDLLCRMDRYGEWVESTLEVLDADVPAALGATLVERARVSGMWTSTIRWRIVEFEPRSRIVFEGTGVTAVEGLGFSVEVADRGAATEFTLTLWYRPRYGPLGVLLELLTRSNVNNDQMRSVRTFAFLAEHRGEANQSR